MAEGKSVIRTLFVFDFDHTLVDDNSDTWIMALCPELNLMENLSVKRKEHASWTRLMDHTFCLIHEQGRSKDEIINHMKKLRIYDQALASIHAIYKCKTADCIIISDSNTIFIDTILQECGIKHMFHAVITNHAYFDESGKLHVKEYHSHNCDTCRNTPNLCKGTVLKKYVSDQKCYQKVVYVGDGRNDYCPSISLTREDVVICRKGYALAQRLHSTSSCQARIYAIDFITSLSDCIITELL